MIGDATLRLAEDTNSLGSVEAGKERIEDPRYVIWLAGGTHPAFNVVQRLRLLREQVEPTLIEVRGVLRGLGVAACTWEIGSSATPSDRWPSG